MGTSNLRGKPPHRILGIVFVFLLILALRHGILLAPPYWDTSQGLWAESNFIVETGFDHSRHLFEEPTFLMGGYANYRTSLVVHLLAIGMWLLPNAQVVIVMYHLTIFAFATMILALVYRLTRNVTNGWGASLVTIALATNPLFSTQIDLLGLEIPVAAWAVLALFLLLEDKLILAAVAGFFCWWMKPTGTIATLAMLTYLIGRRVIEGSAMPVNRRRLYNRGIFANLAVSAIQWTFAFWLDAKSVDRFTHNNWGYFAVVPLWMPDLVLIAVITYAGWIIVVCTELLTVGSGTEHYWRKRFQSIFDRYSIPIFSAIIIAGLAVACAQVPALPRYLTLAVPFLFLMLAHLIFRNGNHRVACTIFTAIIAVNLMNATGALIPSVETCGEYVSSGLGNYYSGEGSLIERSRAYLKDQQADLEAIQALKDHAGTDPVIVGTSFQYYLTMPRLGYVDRPFSGYMADGPKESETTLKSVAEILSNHPRSVVFVKTVTTLQYYFPKFTIPEPGPEDEIIYSRPELAPLIVYRKRFPSTMSDADIDRWYVDHMWTRPDPFSGEPDSIAGTTRYRVKRLLEIGRVDLARYVWEKAKSASPGDAEIESISQLLNTK